MICQWREDQLLYIHTLFLIVIGQQLTDNIPFLDELLLSAEAKLIERITITRSEEFLISCEDSSNNCFIYRLKAKGFFLFNCKDREPQARA